MSQPLCALKPIVGTYVRCEDNPFREHLTKGRFYKIFPNNRLQNDRGQVVFTLARFEPLPPSYLNAFK